MGHQYYHFGIEFLHSESELQTPSETLAASSVFTEPQEADLFLLRKKCWGDSESTLMIGQIV